MDLTPYVEQLRRELAVAAEAGGEEARALAERLTAALESAIRLTLLEALSAAADEITRELAPGAVELRLRGGEPEFVAVAAPAAAPREEPAAPPPDAEEGPIARINLRLPEQLKAGVESTAVWGTTAGMTPGSVRARTTLDNVGVQYGLKALLSGAISAEEFVTLNEKIGGFDADHNRAAARTVADAQALPIAYRGGIVSSGANLGKLPIIDSRGFDEQGIHYIWRSFSERARIDDAYGDHDNQVMWRYGTGLLPATAAQVAAVTVKSFLTMDEWLSNLVATAPKTTLNDVRTHAQVVAAKPSAAHDLCFLTGDPNFTTPVTDMALCDADPRLQKHASPRQVAGGSLAENILKCQLKPLNPSDYAPVAFTAAQWTRLNAAFAGGVCDWSKPGVGQQEAISPLTFAAGPGGVPLPPAPTAQRRQH